MFGIGAVGDRRGDRTESQIARRSRRTSRGPAGRGTPNLTIALAMPAAANAPAITTSSIGIDPVDFPVEASAAASGTAAAASGGAGGGSGVARTSATRLAGAGRGMAVEFTPSDSGQREATTVDSMFASPAPLRW